MKYRTILYNTVSDVYLYVFHKLASTCTDLVPHIMPDFAQNPPNLAVIWDLLGA